MMTALPTFGTTRLRSTADTDHKSPKIPKRHFSGNPSVHRGLLMDDVGSDGGMHGERDMERSSMSQRRLMRALGALS